MYPHLYHAYKTAVSKVIERGETHYRKKSKDYLSSGAKDSVVWSTLEVNGFNTDLRGSITMKKYTV